MIKLEMSITRGLREESHYILIRCLLAEGKHSEAKKHSKGLRSVFQAQYRSRVLGITLVWKFDQYESLLKIFPYSQSMKDLR